MCGYQNRFLFLFPERFKYFNWRLFLSDIFVLDMRTKLKSLPPFMQFKTFVRFPYFFILLDLNRI
jgi:hypothetical protein